MDLNSRKNSTYIVIGIGIFFILIILWQYYSLKNPSGYVLQMEQGREMKDLFFSNSPDSPIPNEERSNFKGLSYFPIDESYVCDAILIPAERRDTLKLMTTNGTMQQVEIAGKLQFTLQGVVQDLTAYEYLDPSQRTYFVPFRDLTTNVSTYGGGRYMDIPIEDELVVDFNTAYNPYCVYNIEYVCPLPPPENFLQLEILAGEKMYHKS